MLVQLSQCRHHFPHLNNLKFAFSLPEGSVEATDQQSLISKKRRSPMHRSYIDFFVLFFTATSRAHTEHLIESRNDSLSSVLATIVCFCHFYNQNSYHYGDFQGQNFRLFNMGEPIKRISAQLIGGPQNKKAQHRSWHMANCNKLYHLKLNINA